MWKSFIIDFKKTNSVLCVADDDQLTTPLLISAFDALDKDIEAWCEENSAISSTRVPILLDGTTVGFSVCIKGHGGGNPHAY